MTLVPPDSPLRLVPTVLDRKAVLFLDGIRYSLHMFDMTSTRLAQTLDSIGRTQVEPNELTDRITWALSDAWLMIDSVHRLRELLEQAPRLKKNTPELQIFLRNTSGVEDLRNFFQHFRTEIDSFTELGMPLWGTLSWAYTNPNTGELENHTIAPGTYFEGAWVASCTFDRDKGAFLEKVLLYAGTKKLISLTWPSALRNLLTGTRHGFKKNSLAQIITPQTSSFDLHSRK